MEPQLQLTSYRNDINGLRALAVLAVVAFHALPVQWELVPGGYTGVDIFFVISGFLISGILFSNLEAGSFSYREFYRRRILRIFPALITVAIASSFAAWFLLLPDEFTLFGKHLTAGMGFAANFALWSEAGYFDRATESKPLLHLWSLAVEEQFYLFWPILLGLLWHRWRRRRVLLVVLLLAALTFLVSVLSVHSHPVATFYLPIARVWEFTAGGTLAYLSMYRPDSAILSERHATARAAAGVGLIFAGFLLLDHHSLFPGFYALAPVLGTVLLISAGPFSPLNRHLLSNRLVVWLGLISYPLYLWHWPILSFLTIVENNPRTLYRAIAVIISLLLARLTYATIEQRLRYSRRPKMPLLLTCACAVLGLIGWASWQGWITPRNDTPQLQPIMDAIADWEYPPEGFDQQRYGGATVWVRGVDNPKQTVLFIGDSHLEQYASRVVWLTNTIAWDSTIIFASRGGCRPAYHLERKHSDSGCQRFMASALEYAMGSDIDTVVFGFSWTEYFFGLRQAAFDYHDVHGKLHHHPANAPIDRFLADTMAFITAPGREKRLILILDNPIGDPFDPKRQLTGSRIIGVVYQPPLEDSLQLSPETQVLREQMKAVADAAGVETIDPVSVLCTNGRCPTSRAGEPIYVDRDHLRASYARQCATFIDVVFR